MPMNDITAIFVTFNSASVIAQAIEAAREEEITNIIVIDNASLDDTRGIVRQQFPGVILIENRKNEGFGRANNIALERVTTPYALLVNPDAVLAPGAVNALLKAAIRYPDAAILAPLLYEEEGQLHHSYKRSVFEREKRRDRYQPPAGDICADFVSGAVWFLNMSIMRQIGFFDPNIFLYYEDDDLCMRARRSGYGLVLVGDASALHLKGASSGVLRPEAEFIRQKYMLWSRLYIEDKYHGAPAAQKLARALHIEYGLKAGWYLMHRNMRKFNRYRGRLAGISEFIAALRLSQAA